MRHWFNILTLGALPLVCGIAHGACLPTLGTDDCFRAADPRLQAIEHHYLDAPHSRQGAVSTGAPPSEKEPPTIAFEDVVVFAVRLYGRKVALPET
jgi:hypothetical protein